MSTNESLAAGTIKEYRKNKGYGFIEPDRGRDDVFFHITNVKYHLTDVEAGDQDVEEGKRVKYISSRGEKGLQADQVYLPSLRVPQDTDPHLRYEDQIENPALQLQKAVFFEPQNGKSEVSDLPSDFPNVSEDILGRVREEYRRMLNRQPGIEVSSFERPVERRLAIGLGRASVYETNLTLHPTYGIPYVPGSGVKGAVRSFVMLSLFYDSDDEQTEARAFQDPLFRALFGADASAPEGARQGRVCFYDAYPTTRPTISADIMTPHFQDYYQDASGDTPPTDDMDPTPIPFLTVEDTTFAFSLGERPRADDPQTFEESTILDNTPASSQGSLLDVAEHWLKRTLAEHGIGAKTAVGYGFFPEEE